MAIRIIDRDAEGKAGGTLYELTASIRLKDMEQDKDKAAESAKSQIAAQIDYILGQLSDGR